MSDSTPAVLEPMDSVIEQVLLGGDLSKLKPKERLAYYNSVCSALGLNPLTKPFSYIQLNGKLQLYALKDATEQLRNLRDISVTIKARESVEGCYVVTAQARKPSGRQDESIGAVPIDGVKGEARANAMMKAETKAKRRVTLSICGLGMLDETEVSSIPDALVFDHDADIEPPGEDKKANGAETVNLQTDKPPEKKSAEKKPIGLPQRLKKAQVKLDAALDAKSRDEAIGIMAWAKKDESFSPALVTLQIYCAQSLIKRIPKNADCLELSHELRKLDLIRQEDYETVQAAIDQELTAKA